MSTTPTPAKGLRAFEWKHDEMAAALVCHIDYQPDDVFDGRPSAAYVVVCKVFARDIDILPLLSDEQLKWIEKEAQAAIERENAEAAAEFRARHHGVLEAA